MIARSSRGVPGEVVDGPPADLLRLPEDLREATDLFEASELARETLGERLCEWIVLNKRRGYRKAFANYNLKKIAAFDDAKVEELYGPISGLPTTFVIDRRGTIRQQWTGAQPRDVMKSAILDLL